MKKHLVPCDYVVVSVGPVRHSTTTASKKKGFRFANEQVRIIKSKKIAYLRSRYDIVKGTVTHSLRTQSHGNGVEIVRAKPEPIAQAGSALDRLYKRVPFEFVVYVPYMSFDEVSHANTK